MAFEGLGIEVEGLVPTARHPCIASGLGFVGFDNFTIRGIIKCGV